MMNNAIIIRCKNRSDYLAILEQYSVQPDVCKTSIKLSTILSPYFRTTEQLQDLQDQFREKFPDMPGTFVTGNNNPTYIIKNMISWLLRTKPATWHYAFDTIEIRHTIGMF